MPKSYYTYAILSGLISGIMLGYFFNLTDLIYPSLFFSVFSIAAFFVIKRKKLLKQFLILLILFLIPLILGTYRTNTAFEINNDNHISNYLDTNITTTAKIVEEVDERADKIKYTLQISELKIMNTDTENEKKVETQNIASLQNNIINHPKGRILLDGPKYPAYEYGDILEIKGKLETPPDDEEFSYKNYLSRYETYGIIKTRQIEKLDAQPNSLSFAYIYKAKKYFLNLINSNYREPDASFLAGLLIGARKGMDADITLDFQKVGLSHIVAVSGSNITMVIAIIMTLLAFLPRRISFVIALISIILFTIFVGMSAAVVRAAIMGVIGLIAIHTGRTNAPLIAMLITIAIMGLWQPKMYFYDVGFQLSIFAVIGVIWVVPLLPKFLQDLPEAFGLKEAITLTIAASISVLPISIIHFKAFSIIAPIANLFVVPIIPFACLLGFLSLIPIPIISDILIFITHLSLKVSIFFAHYFAKIPYAYIENINLPYWIWGIYFVIMGWFFWKKHQKLK